MRSSIATPDHWHALHRHDGVRRRQGRVPREADDAVRPRGPLAASTWPPGTSASCRSAPSSGPGEHYAKARDLIRGGHIGKVVSVRMSNTRNVMPGFGSPADGDPPADLDYDRWLGPAPARKYNPNRSLYHFRWFWDYAGGQMTNLGAHHLDIVDWVLGLDTLEVRHVRRRPVRADRQRRDAGHAGRAVRVRRLDGRVRHARVLGRAAAGVQPGVLRHEGDARHLAVGLHGDAGRRRPAGEPGAGRQGRAPGRRAAAGAGRVASRRGRRR